MGDRTLDYIALCVLIFVVVMIIYGIIFIHDIPYEIAKKRKHPHQDAIHTAGWVSLFLMHTIWPFLWIWATLYKPGLGWGFEKAEKPEAVPEKKDHIDDLLRRIAILEQGEIELKSRYRKEVEDLQSRLARLEEQLSSDGEA